MISISRFRIIAAGKKLPAAIVLAVILVVLIVLVILVILVAAVVLILLLVLLIILVLIHFKVPPFIHCGNTAVLIFPKIQDLSFALNIMPTSSPAVIAAVIPPAAAFNPPVNTPIKLSESIASFTPFESV